MKRRTAFLRLWLIFSIFAFLFTASRAAAGGEQLQSRRIQVLKKELDAGNRAALDVFWQQVRKQTTPIVEIVEGDPRHLLVTFVWRAKEETRNVYVYGGAGGYEIEKNRMARLLDTDLWFKTYKVRSDARFMYSLSPNDSLVPLSELYLGDAKAVMQRLSTFKPDPLNPRTMPQNILVQSFVELPDAPPQPYSVKQPDVPAGRVEEQKIRSLILNNNRKIWVYTPPNYQTTGQPYGLLILFDGMGYVARVPTPVILDNLIARNKIPPIVAVIVDNVSPASRNVELPCNREFADFLAKELVPWVRRNYHTTADPKQTIVAGSSLGGLAAMWAGFRYPQVFGNVLSQSGAYWWRPEANSDGEHEWLTKQFVARAKLPLKIHMDVGLLETGATPGDGPSLLISNRHLRDVLRAKGYAVDYTEFNGGHEVINWRGTLADGLLYLIGTESAERKRK